MKSFFISLFFVLSVTAFSQTSKIVYLTADRVFDGVDIHEGWAVLVDPMQEINNAYERMVKNDVRYRFVIDIKSLG